MRAKVWQGSVNACCVCDGVRVLLVLWYVEVHKGDELVILDDHLIGLQLAQAQILFNCCWCSPSAMASSLVVCHDAARVIPLVGVPARNLHEGGVQHDASLGGEGEGDGVGLEVGGNQMPCSIAEEAFHVTL